MTEALERSAWSRIIGMAWILPLLCWVLLLAGPHIGMEPRWVRETMLIATTALIVSGLNLSLGWAGELSMGQVAFFASAAYTTGYLTKEYGADIAVTLVVSILVAALLGLLSGLPGIRLGGWSLALLSFFMVLLVPDVVSLFEEQTGGHAGMAAIPTPELFGRELDTNAMYTLVLVLSGIWFVLYRNLVISRHGVALRVLRESPILARSLGVNVVRLKLTAYVLGAIPAGIAGCLFALINRFLDVQLFGFMVVISIIAASVLGGSESIYGAVLGAVLLRLGPSQSSLFEDYALVAYGAFLLIGGVILSGGVSGLLGTVLARLMPPPEVSPAIGETELTLDPIDGERLVLNNVSKRFGGVAALQGVNLIAQPGDITAIIGANGSGKTTLLNLVSGFYSADDGSIRLGDRALAGSSHHIARNGVARTFQTPIIPESLTTGEVVASARYQADATGLGSAMVRLPKYRRALHRDREVARRVLTGLGLAHLEQHPAAELPLGRRRIVEVGRALALEPALVLLDEPFSGLDVGDRDHVGHVVEQLRDAGATVVLVEHDFDRVLALANRIYVLEAGKVIAEGTAAEVRESAVVAASYLGRGHQRPAASDEVLIP